MALTPVSIGSARFRVGAWQDAADVAYLAVASAAATLAPWVLAALRDRLRDQGYRAVFTAAVGPRERDALIGDGFSVRSELVTLNRDLEAEVPRLVNTRGRTRRGRWRDLDGVLQVDAAAPGGDPVRACLARAGQQAPDRTMAWHCDCPSSDTEEPERSPTPP